MRGEQLGEGEAGDVVLRHAQRQRLGAAQHQERIERRQDGALCVLDEPQPLDVLVACGNHHASDAVAVTVEILGRAVDDEVGAERDRLLQARAGEGVVDRQTGAVPVRQLRHGGEVGQAHQGIARRFGKQQARGGRERALDGVEIGHVEVGEGQLVAASAPCRTAGMCRRRRCRRRSRDRRPAAWWRLRRWPPSPTQRQMPPDPVSMAARLFSSARRVGFCVRAYSKPLCFPSSSWT